MSDLEEDFCIYTRQDGSQVSGQYIIVNGEKKCYATTSYIEVPNYGFHIQSPPTRQDKLDSCHDGTWMSILFCFFAAFGD